MDFTTYTKPDYLVSWHHQHLANKLTAFAEGRIKRLMVFMPPRHGKALQVDTPIPTPAGWVRIRDLKPGDKVFDEGGKVCNVVAVSPTWKDRTCYKVRTDDGDMVVADEEHEWMVRLCRKRPVFKVKTTGNLASRSCDRAPTVTASGPLELPERELPIDPYVLGVWLGDGCSYHATITQGEQDIQFVRSEIERCGYETKDRATRGTFGISGILVHLRAMGVLGAKSIPCEYLRASASQRLSLLQGLVDTDGHVAPDGQVEICSVSQQIAIKAAELVASLGHKASIIEGDAILDGRIIGRKYRVMFYMDGAARMPRKLERCRHGLRAFRRYLTFEPAGKADTCCIEVDSPNHLFLCGRSMIPTHNSELTSRRLPAYIFGRNPNARIIGCSYGASLAVAMSRDIQRIIDSPEYGRLFSDTRLSGKHIADSSLGSYRRTSDVFEIVGHTGVYNCAGVGGGITGKGFDFGLIDDPLKGAEDADSPVIREKQWDWLNNDFLTRQEAGASILLTLTRWHRDDIAGRLLAQSASDPRADKWEVVCFPAERVDMDNPDDPRQLGEALWADRYGHDYLDAFRANPRTWQALYQQNPTADGGSEWPDHCFEGDIWVEKMPANVAFRSVALDPSKGKESKSGDYSAIVGAGVTDDLIYVEASLERRNPTRIIEDLFGFCEQFRPHAVGFEANQFQELFSPLIDHAAADPRFATTHLARQLSVGQSLYTLINTIKKELRIRRLSTNITGRKFRFVRSPGTQLLVDQLRDFPNASYDDGPDALEMALRIPIVMAGGDV